MPAAVRARPLEWLAQHVGTQGTAVGFDLSAPHTAAARGGLPGRLVVQANLLQPPFPARSFDLVWCVNTVNHVPDPVRGVAALKGLLRAGGLLALGQSSLLPEMYFAWDARLERLTNAAVRRYYQERYAVSERGLAHVRGLVGWLRAAGLSGVTAHTVAIERTAPLRPADEAYLIEAVFRGTWGERLRPYMDSADYAQLERLCDPADAQFALRRPDFHFLQCLTIVTGST
jgi:SAM-dependent methyltransferase